MINNCKDAANSCRKLAKIFDELSIEENKKRKGIAIDKPKTEKLVRQGEAILNQVSNLSF